MNHHKIIHFLRAAFRVTRLQLAVVCLLSVIKYVITAYHIWNKMEIPFAWVCIALLIELIIAAGIMGIIENREGSVEQWKLKPKISAIEKCQLFFATWGVGIPLTFFYLCCLICIVPTCWYMFIWFYAGLVIRNVFGYFSKKQNNLSTNETIL